MDPMRTSQVSRGFRGFWSCILSQSLLIVLVIELRASYILRHSLPPPPPTPLSGARAVLVVATALEGRGIGFFVRSF